MTENRTTQSDDDSKWQMSGTKSPIVRVKKHAYQPSKAELDADVGVDVTPDDIAKAIVTPVRVIEED